MKKSVTSFESDLMAKLRDPKFASDYIASATVDNDMEFLTVALGDVAKAHDNSEHDEELENVLTPNSADPGSNET